VSLEVSLPECEDPLPLGSSPSPDLSSGIPGIVGSSLSSSKVGRMTRSDGTVQLTYDGKPLYFYSAEDRRLASSPPLGTVRVGRLPRQPKELLASSRPNQPRASTRHEKPSGIVVLLLEGLKP
jgi:hypothetical protein